MATGSSSLIDNSFGFREVSSKSSFSRFPNIAFLRLFLFIATVALGIDFQLISAEINHSPVTYPFPISESELRTIAKELAPKVDLFSAVWELDPDAEFFAGTTRDFLYWILGHFRGLDAYTKEDRDHQIEEIKKRLLSRPFIKFSEIVGPESDADIMTKNKSALSKLSAEDFAIRKLDFISFNRATIADPVYKDEIDQGYIPVEKIRLGKSGITTDSNFGNGVQDLISGSISVHFPELNKFWATHYAKMNANHPLLLAVRYIRILSQDYLHRHSSEIPDLEKLEAPMSPFTKKHIQELVSSAIIDKDGSFYRLLRNERGLRWLNASLQKSFRSYTNANAAFELMKNLGVLPLIEVYPKSIESVHQYLLQVKKDSLEVEQKLSEFGFNSKDIFQDPEHHLPNLEIYHGTSSELAFRSIIYQGVIPSEYGSAGRGFYGVSKESLPFAMEWSERKSQVKDLVIALKLKPDTKVVDITKGKGKELFDQWILFQRSRKSHQNDSKTKMTDTVNNPTSSELSLYDSFAEAFGIDLLRYPYGSTEAFVLKNASQIQGKRGVFKNPRSISDLLLEAEKAKSNFDLSFMKDFVETPLTKNERLKVLSVLGDPFLKRIFSIQEFSKLDNILKERIGLILEWIFQYKAQNHEFDKNFDIWTIWIPLIKDPSFPSIIKNQNFALQPIEHFLVTHQPWPKHFCSKIPELLEPTHSIAYSFTVAFITRSLEGALNFRQPHLSKKIWKKLAASISHPDVEIEIATKALITLSPHLIWPIFFWKTIHRLLRKDDWPHKARFLGLIRLQKQTPNSIWALIPELLKRNDSEIDRSLGLFLKQDNRWPEAFVKRIPDLLRASDHRVQLKMLKLLPFLRVWNEGIWLEISSLLKSAKLEFRSALKDSLQSQDSWKPPVWEIFLEHLKNPDPGIRAMAIESLLRQIQWPRKIRNQLFKLMFNPHEDEQAAISTLLLKSPAPLSKKLWRRFPQFFSRLSKTEQYAAIIMLRRKSPFKKELWKVINDSLLSPDINIQSAALDALSVDKDWPKEIWESLQKLVLSAESFLIPKIILAITSQNLWPSVMWTYIPNLLAAPKFMFEDPWFLLRHWPMEFWRRVPDLLSSPDLNIQLGIAKALELQNSWPKEVWDKIAEILSLPGSPHTNTLVTVLSRALMRQKAWTQAVIDIVNSSHSDNLALLQLSKPSILEFPVCNESLQDLSTQTAK